MLDEMVGWHHRLDGQEFVHTPGDGQGQGSLACCSPWGCRVRHDRAAEQQILYQKEHWDNQQMQGLVSATAIHNRVNLVVTCHQFSSGITRNNNIHLLERSTEHKEHTQHGALSRCQQNISLHTHIPLLTFPAKFYCKWHLLCLYLFSSAGLWGL